MIRRTIDKGSATITCRPLLDQGRAVWPTMYSLRSLPALAAHWPTPEPAIRLAAIGLMETETICLARRDHCPS